jgi:hypothetical protein
LEELRRILPAGVGLVQPLEVVAHQVGVHRREVGDEDKECDKDPGDIGLLFKDFQFIFYHFVNFSNLEKKKQLNLATKLHEGTRRKEEDGKIGRWEGCELHVCLILSS